MMEWSLLQCVHNKTKETKVSSFLTPPAGHSVQNTWRKMNGSSSSQLLGVFEEKQSTS